MASENNKRIAKNTGILYIRMFITMGVSLYTSRVVLATLGVNDFGIYNIVGGIIVLFSFLKAAMTSSTQRFLNYELGLAKNDNYESVKRIFSMSMTAHISIILLFILASETIGLWFLNTQLNIPQERMLAANWVYQFSLLALSIEIIKVPYHASIIAYEKMTFFAYVSIAEVIFKLLIVFALLLFSVDKLILYSFLVFVVTFAMLTIYKIYCNKVFITCRYNFFWDASLYKQLMSFSGWSLFGSVANVGAQQGVNILLNVFYGVSINAAMGVANQVSSAINSFVSSFQTAFNPQIVKSYAANDQSGFISLIFQASKFSYYLLYAITLPVILNIDIILNIWLKNVPSHSAFFIILILMFLLIDAISAPLWMSVQATGKIKNYQILMGAIIILNLPLSYICLKLGYIPESVLIIRVFINFTIFIVRIFYLRIKIKLPTKLYFEEVIFKVALVTLLSIPLPLLISYYTSNFNGLVLTSFFSVVSVVGCIYLFGLTKRERKFVEKLIIKKLSDFSKK